MTARELEFCRDLELGAPTKRRICMTRTGWIAFVVLALAVAGCSANHRKATPPPTTSTTVSRPVTASARCSEVLGRGVVSSATTTVDKRSEEHTSELQSQFHLVCRLLLE